jgi:DNA segregation ATPase FtsK/SpoIIIE-like protein
MPLVKGNSFKRFRPQIAIRLARHAGHRLGGGSSDQLAASKKTDGKFHVTRIEFEDGRSAVVDFDAPDVSPAAINDDIWKTRFQRRRGMTKAKRLLSKSRRLIRRVMAFMSELANPKYSSDEKMRMLIHLQKWQPEDLADYRTKREEERNFLFHKQQAKLVSEQIIKLLTNLEFSHHTKKEDRIYVKKRITFRNSYVSPYTYVYVANEMPYGVRATSIAEDWVANELSLALGKKVHIDLGLNGLRITVEVASTLSIPDFATFADSEKMPKASGPLTFYAGKTTNGADVYRNLAEAPHMIVAGQTGGGKSNLLNNIICGYMKQDPNVVQMIMFDLKSGIEFAPFYGVPHLWKAGNDNDGIIEYPEGVIPALQSIHKETDRRIKLIKEAGNKKIEEYNRAKTKNRLPYIVVFVDEYAIARSLGGQGVEKELVNIANKSRVAGIHFIIATQYPKAEIFSPLIKVNFPWRIAFNMTSGASMSVINSWDASGLSPVGRAILQTSEGDMYVQTPRITESTIHSIVDAAKGGTQSYRVTTLDPEEIIRWALNNTAGKLDGDTIYAQFKDRMAQAKVQSLLKAMDNNEYEVEGEIYYVRQPVGNTARRVERIEGSRIEDFARNKEQGTEKQEKN